ncbi:flavin reductase family protein [Kitasatospora sp. NBC_01250]|uniref:flavin reductase family protein n=1 Tax=unclassified Kitasatospora TaxID=2633591 RepID=UPI002E1102B4|nr:MULTISPECIES: flavin reductase family protein [unclassified Kitasatospora]WSJ71263.1 flavin reductase family protein [Kitasatospora sp. NBC_01302]
MTTRTDVDASQLRSVLRSHAAGIVVLTAPGPVGVTITSFTSISAEPALVSFALAETSSTWQQVRDSEWFGIQILSAEQRDLAQLFASKGADRFGPATRWRLGPHGVPLLDDCLSWLVCSRQDTLRIGDHHVVVAAVEHARQGAPGDSLVHLHGAMQPVPHPALVRS